MTQHNTIKLFEAKKVRTIWDDKDEKWYFSIVDVVAVLTDSPNPRKYWSVLKTRLKKEGSELTTNCSQLKMKSADGKMYLTDVADTQQLLRLIQSIPSPKAEPFKQWMAQVATERLYLRLGEVAPIHAFGRVDISGKGIERQTPVVPCNGNDVFQHNHVAPHGIGAAFLLRAQKILEIVDEREVEFL